MITDFRRTDAPTEYEADLCIVGSGAAGITLAANAHGLRVIVVEAGGRRPPDAPDDGLAGEASDFAFDGFENGRLRAFGGATRLWAGQCIRLDPIDLERRAWVPHSGWPITAEELAPFYDRAESFVGLPAAQYDAGIWRRAGLADPGFAADVTAKFTAYMPQPDFTKAFGWKLVQNRHICLLLNAAVTRIDCDGATVTGVQVRAEDGRAGRVRARATVLCGGGIENPRLLLASGIGNDRVGRFFQDHPSGTTGHLQTSRPHALQRQFRKLRRGGVTYWPKLALTEAAQRREQTLNANAIMLYDYAERSPLTRAKAALEAARTRQPAAIAREASRLLRHMPELAIRAAHTVATGKAPVFAPSAVMLKAHVEQAPDPDNRVTLSAERDRFGLPRPRLAWRVREPELRTLRAVTAAAGAELSRLRFGDVTEAAWLSAGEAAVRAALEDTYHHAGTTRMARDESEGVTDPHCRVFGTANLFVAGGSVFPTSGYANPTLTIVALALRLGDRLAEELA